MEKTFISSLQLDQLILNLSNHIFKCCNIIQQISTDPMVFSKDSQNDPVTSADYLIQLSIVNILKDSFPSIKIVGEETLDQENQNFLKVKNCSINVESFQSKEKVIFEALPFKTRQQNQYLIEKLAIWIDPLDCTRGFVSNHKQQVTILIGISYQNRPIVGIIGHPYKINSAQNINPYIFKPTVTIGTTESSIEAAFEFSLDSNLWKIHKKKSNTNVSNIVAISSRRQSEVQKKIISEVQMISKRAGGAGNKILMLIRRQVDTVMFIDVKTSKWDSCAGEAIIRGMGGQTIKPNLECIDYDPDEQHLNRQGFIFSLNNNVYKQIQKILQNQFCH